MNDKIKSYLIHIGLFLLTFFSTTFSGSFFISGKMWGWTDYSWVDFTEGMKYSIPFLLILTVHEFGHYFTARFNKVSVTLPFYIPLPPIPFLIGTMGAVIRIKEAIKSNRLNFDVGIAGPLAGFIIALACLIYGYSNLPSQDYLFEIHPEYEQFGDDYADHVYSRDFLLERHKAAYEELRAQDSLQHYAADSANWKFKSFEPLESYDSPILGTSILLKLMESIAPNDSLIPHQNELMHYPFILAGFLGLFFTALNLMPIGQLDGGHILYGLVGAKLHARISTVYFVGFIFFGGLGLVSPFMPYETLVWAVPVYIFYLYVVMKAVKTSNQTTILMALVIFATQFLIGLYFPNVQGFAGWLVFGFILSRVLGIYHPKSAIEKPLDLKRKILGWLALIIFVISFSPVPLEIG